ncbi:MAG TPA: hypothetical protein VGQ83_07075 [Polyangia bacterium]|jgi:hypothetical protein
MTRRVLTLVAELAALAALAGTAACERPQARLAFKYELKDQSGDPVECERFADLGCVNFIRFQLSAKGGTDMLTHCVKVERRLGTLCDLPTLAQGTELFNRDPDDTIVVTMSGLRAFPADTCEFTAACPPRELFSGIAGPKRIGDLAGGTLEMTVRQCTDCGAREEFRQLAAGQTCEDACETGRPGNAVVCPPPGSGLSDVQGGCVCRVAPAQTDAGVDARHD